MPYSPHPTKTLLQSSSAYPLSIPANWANKDPTNPAAKPLILGQTQVHTLLPGKSTHNDVASAADGLYHNFHHLVDPFPPVSQEPFTEEAYEPDILSMPSSSSSDCSETPNLEQLGGKTPANLTNATQGPTQISDGPKKTTPKAI